MSAKSVTMQIDVRELTRELIDIPSITGAEQELAGFLERYLAKLGYEVDRQEVVEGRDNIIAVARSRPAVFLSTHMDTVPPFIAAREDAEFIYGRGACDAKGIIAAQICAAEKLRAAGENDFGLLFTVDEEAGSAGAKRANTHEYARSCRYLINGEPTDNQLAIGSKGSLQATIHTTGRAAHSAYPEQGESAIEKLLEVLSEIRRIAWPASEILGETTCNIGVISGGTRSNVIPAEARAVLHLRLATKADQVKQLLEDSVAGRTAIEYGSIHDPQQMLALEGFAQCTVRFTTDIPYLSNWGTPVLIGPGSILDAHTEHEQVAKQDLLHAADLYYDLTRQLLQQSRGEAV